MRPRRARDLCRGSIDAVHPSVGKDDYHANFDWIPEDVTNLSVIDDFGPGSAVECPGSSRDPGWSEGKRLSHPSRRVCAGTRKS